MLDLTLKAPSTQDLKMFEFYKKNPDIACIKVLNQDLAPFQRIVIKNTIEHPYSIDVLSRGSGKTRMIAMIGAILGIFNPKMKIGFLGPTFRVSKYAFAEFEALVSESDQLEACVKRISKQSDKWEAEFYNGAFLYALPLAADSAMSIRGTRLHMALIDEYPHVPIEVLERVINPMLATMRNPMANVRRIEKEKRLLAAGKITEKDLKKNEKNRVAGFSSAYFKFNHMWDTICKYQEASKEQLAKYGKTDYSVNIFNYHDAPEGFFDISMIEHAKRTSSEVTFAMEYLSEFPDDSYGFYRRSLIESCKAQGLFYFEPRGDKNGKYILGIDPARSSDNFAIAILKIVDGQMRLVRILSFENTPFPVMAENVRNLLRLYPVEMIAMDAGGGGLTMKDLLADPMTADNKTDVILDLEDEENITKEGRRILKMIDFAPKWIVDANFEMRSSMEHKKLLFPDLNLGDKYIKPEEDKSDVEDTMLFEFLKLVDELQSIIMSETKTGVLHFDTKENHMKKDRYSALLLAHSAAYHFIKNGFDIVELAEGGFLGQNGKLMNIEEKYEWNETRILDEIHGAKLAYDNRGMFEGHLIKE